MRSFEKNDGHVTPSPGDGGSLSHGVKERDSNNVPLVSYTRGRDLSGTFEGAGGIGGLLARSDGYDSGSGIFSSSTFYFADGNGNITYLTDATQGLAASYKYDPFGHILAESGPLATDNSYRFSSKEMFAKNLDWYGAIYYFGYRFYDPNWQRWLNRDPIGGRDWCNLYGFVHNEPVGGTDPLGLQGPYSDPYGGGPGHFRDTMPAKEPGGEVELDHETGEPSDSYADKRGDEEPMSYGFGKMGEWAGNGVAKACIYVAEHFKRKASPAPFSACPMCPINSIPAFSLSGPRPPAPLTLPTPPSGENVYHNNPSLKTYNTRNQ